MFEIKSKDAKGRIGILKTAHGEVRTPALMPVIHPRKQTIDVGKLGAEIVITNAYLIYKDENLKQIAIEDGVHNLINFDGPVMTDSGSFQLSVYGDVDISNEEVMEFQELIKTDIGTSLDIPTAPYVTFEKAKSDMDVTLERAKEAKEYKDEHNIKMLLNSVVQGSTFSELRAYCADELSKLDCDLYPIGAVVPLMEMYHYSDLVDVVMSSISHLPDSKPRHLMGAGHPMIFALAVAMGCDLFDSAAYILYAEDDRFLTTRGTYKLENLQEMPCSCEICTKYTPDDLRNMDKKERVNLIAEHNLNVSFAEIRLIKQAIYDGNLMELVEERCRVHPMLLDAYRRLKEYSDDLETYDPRVKKSAFYYTGSESLARPEIRRHLNKLNNMDKKKNLVILPNSRKPYSKYLQNDLGDFYVYGEEKDIDLDNTDFMVADIPFCLIPLNIDEVYPLSQNESPKISDIESLEFVEDFILNFIEMNYSQTLVHNKVVDKFNLGLFTIHPQSNEVKFKLTDHEKIIAIADYQFGKGAGKALFEGKIEIEKSKKTGKIRHVYSSGELVANMRAHDSFFVLALEGARRLHRIMKYPDNRVIVNEDSESFAKEGKSVFSKFVIDCDKKIKANDEVLIVNKNDELLAFGKSLLNYNEIMDFNVGQAIKTRKGNI
ncbi:tRNA guanosine(15) transglycosylase TgtA [Methanobrevibacter filiformis]|uniref:tRNA-guanine(15) transglycosylase n=1 Tax=Methanobrevibacter filiformis TaxID=55758 RepID=A0A166DA59_9EURY|nr:tRNA guanosine(15) transglycosylase TgtA [Methanobrevibacter filiformis]KZX15366.1 queuine tRNA-ribosyltransferase [Methanobrevibacter filiformis]